MPVRDVCRRIVIRDRTFQQEARRKRREAGFMVDRGGDRCQLKGNYKDILGQSDQRGHGEDPLDCAQSELQVRDAGSLPDGRLP